MDTDTRIQPLNRLTACNGSPASCRSRSRRRRLRRSDLRRLVLIAALTHSIADSMARRRTSATTFNSEERSLERFRTFTSVASNASLASARDRICKSSIFRSCLDMSAETLWLYSFSFTPPAFFVAVVVVAANVDFVRCTSQRAGEVRGRYIVLDKSTNFMAAPFVQTKESNRGWCGAVYHPGCDDRFLYNNEKTSTKTKR